MIRLLLVEDDPSLSASLTTYLSNEGYTCTHASTLRSANEILAGGAFQLIILDWMLPDGQGIDWLRDLRGKMIDLPIILLTARSELTDKVIGLEIGANDYLTKPFEPRELVARIRVQLRQSLKPAVQAARDTNSSLRLNFQSREVLYQGRPVELTKMEFDLLKLLHENPGRVFSREELLNQVWGYERFPTTRTVDTHILQLRQKLEEQLFETVRGIGYRFRPEFRPESSPESK